MIQLEQLAGHQMVVGFAGAQAPASLLQRIADGRVGGVILFARNIESPAQVARLNAELQAAAPPGRPLLIGVDQEGGRVQRLRAPMTVWPPMARLGELDDLELTREVGQAMGRDLALLGFNLDFAPVLDVVSEAENTVIGDRSFGADPARVAGHGLAFARGLLAGGVLPCGKHFPGHGGPVADSHLSLPHERRVAGELARIDQAPFEAAVAADLPLLMTAHVLYKALDPVRPGTLSRVICADLLRGRLGFEGALISDDLEMKAISGDAPPGEAALAALMAGVDLLLMCEAEERQLQALDYLVHAAENTEEVRVRLGQAAARTEALLRRIPEARAVDPDQVESMVQDGVHQDLILRLS